MRPNGFALAAMLAAAALSGSGCWVVAGAPRQRAGEPAMPLPQACSDAAVRSHRAGGRPLGGDELAALSRLEAASPGAEEFRGGYYYEGAYYSSPAEDFMYGLLGIAALVGLIIFLDNNADEAHIHTEVMDVHINND